MKFIPRVDEVLLGPPFWLGKYPGSGSVLEYKFRSHVFLLETDPTTLQSLIKTQLNDAFPKGPVRYVVPTNLKYLWLAFLRYERAEARSSPTKGWLAYTEVLIGFLVRREHEDKSQPDEYVGYLGVVYIDDEDYDGPVKDPSAVPIVLGREAYGLPKNPGNISYELLPAPEYTKCVKLDVWDWSKSGVDQLQLATAIDVCPDSWLMLSEAYMIDLPLIGRLWRSIRRPRAAGRLVRPDFSFIARQFGFEVTDLTITEIPGREHAYFISLPDAPPTEAPAIAYDNLLWNTKLVGLKQFPDPKSSGDAAYQVAVESPLQAVKPLDPVRYVLADQRIKFPPINRVDLMKAFGIQPSNPSVPGEVVVPNGRVFYQDGVLLFADPGGVNVFVPA